MERAIALGDTITTTGAVGDSGAGARIPAAESRAAGASHSSRFDAPRCANPLHAALADHLGRQQPFVRNGPIGFLTNRVGRDSVPIRAAQSMIEL